MGVEDDGELQWLFSSSDGGLIVSERRPVVCVVIDGTEASGDVMTLIDTLRAFRMDLFRIHVVSLRTPRGLEITIQKLQVPVHSLDLPDEDSGKQAWWTFAGTMTLMNLMRKMKPELVWTLGHRSEVCGRAAARMAKVPRVVTTLRHPHAVHGLRGMALRGTAHMADLYVVPTESLAREATDRYGIHPQRVAVIPPGVDASRTAGVPSEDIQAFKGSDGQLITCITNLHERKGVDDLVDAFAIVARYHPKTKLLVCGSGVRGIQSIRRAQKLGLEDRVLFPGPRDDVGGVLAATDIFVYPAHQDGPALAVLEALAAGVPVVTTDLPAWEGLLENEAHALLVTPRYPAFLADRIDRLLNDAELRKRLATNGRALVRNFFTAESAASTFQDVCAQLLGHEAALGMSV